ncbi:MAG: hypothetical protein M3303_10755, partial [Gemmatimonadota bacterium]|nr:hypothetical protein [Gemmatimonadota bacterium]
MQSGNPGLFWPVVAIVAFVDVITKAVAMRLLAPQRVPHEVIGEAVRFTLVYNPGAARKSKPMPKKQLAHFEKRLLEERRRVLKELGHHGETFGASQQES